MRNLALFPLLLAPLSAASQQPGCIDPAQIDPTAICFLVYDPVCGCDGITYDNDCFAFNSGVTEWTAGECGMVSECIDPLLIDPEVGCLEIYDPVCGCDGQTYPNSCYAMYVFGVSEWTEGECITGQVPQCSDLADVDFGLCDMLLGIGVVNGVCAYVSGCTWVVDGIDYSSAMLPSMDYCYANCVDVQQAAPCTDLAPVDFGACAMPLGIGLVNNECVMLSGCHWVVGNVDYTPALYQSMDECQACIVSSVDLQRAPLRLSPNPAHSMLVVEAPVAGTLDLFNASGHRVLEAAVQVGSNRLNVSGLPSGIYLLRHRVGGQSARVVVE